MFSEEGIQIVELCEAEIVIMRPKSEQEIWNENVANMQLKLAPKKDFERLLNESYDPIANAMRRLPKLTEEEAEAMAKAFGF